MAKKDKKKKDDDPGPAVTGVDWMNDGFGDGFGPLSFDEDVDDKEEEEVKPKKGKGKAKSDDAGGGKKLQQQQGKGKKGKQKEEQPASSGWNEPTAGTSGWADTTDAYSSAMGGAWDAPAATDWSVPAATHDQGQWAQPGASTSQTPYSTASHTQPAAPPAAGWGTWGGAATATPSMSYASAGHPVWIPTVEEDEEVDDYGESHGVHMAHLANQRNNTKGKNTPQKPKQQWQQDTAQDWSMPHAEPATQHDWSSFDDRKRKGKQKESSMDPPYPANYVPYAQAQAYAYTAAPPPPQVPLAQPPYETAFAVASSEGHGIVEARVALFGRHRLSTHRIHWIFSPHHDESVRETMVYVQDPQVKQELAEIGLRHFVSAREPGCFFINAGYRLPDRPNTPAVDWLPYQTVQGTSDRTMQRSLMYYDPGDFVIVFVFLVSRTGNSMACWRRRIPIPANIKAPYRAEIAKVKAEMKTRDYRILVDAPEEMAPGVGFSPMRAASWTATPAPWPTGIPPTPMPPPPADKPKGGWFNILRR